MNQNIIQSREKDLGGFFVRRVLPSASRRMVGPFIFFDHMGPAELPAGKGMDVRPHPHIHLATVTYLFEGVIHHRDSLGSDQLIKPGAINWMTAGRGIVHSERSPAEFRETGGKMNGIQLWVALPREHEETEPSFKHHPAETLPTFNLGQAKFKILLGSLANFSSPVNVHSKMFYLEGKIPRGEIVKLATHGHEAAFYVVTGRARAESLIVETHEMFVVSEDQDLVVEAIEDLHVMVIGGEPLGARLIFWNFVSSSAEKIEEAKADWKRGPGVEGSRFKKVPGDETEFIPLPEEK